MATVRLSRVVSSSSESTSTSEKVSNLLTKSGSSESVRGWKTKVAGDPAWVVLQLEKSCKLSAIDVGNWGSAFVEILVGKSTNASAEFQVLLPAAIMMTLKDSRSETNMTKVRMFKTDDFSSAVSSQTFDRVKVVCTQPFNKKITHGISFISVFGETSDEEGAVSSPMKELPIIKSAKAAQPKVKTKEKPKSKVKSEPKAPSSSSKQPKLTDMMGLKREASDPIESTSPPSKKPKTQSSTKTEPQTSASATGGSSKPSRTSALRGVVVVLSGYENPARSDIRNALLSLGAVYRPSWNDSCTHLVCAFKNTPKFKEVEGSGVIVGRGWVDECVRKGERMPYGKHLMGRLPKGHVDPCVDGAKTSEDGYDDDTDVSDAEMDTDDEIEAASKPLPKLPTLPDHFNGRTFFLYGFEKPAATDNGDFVTLSRKNVYRLAVAYGGKVSEYMGKDVDTVIVNGVNDSKDTVGFAEALAANPSIKFVRPSWVHNVHKAQTCVSLGSHQVEWVK